MAGINFGMNAMTVGAAASLVFVAGCGSVPGVGSSAEEPQSEAGTAAATQPGGNIGRAAELTKEFILPNAAENGDIISRGAAVLTAECLSTDAQEVAIDETKFQVAYHPEFHTPGQYFTEMQPIGFAKYVDNPDALAGYRGSPKEGEYNADVFNVDVRKILMDSMSASPEDVPVGKVGVPLSQCMMHVMGTLSGASDGQSPGMDAMNTFGDVGDAEYQALAADSVAEPLKKYQECVGGKFSDPTDIPKKLDVLAWKVAHGEGNPQDIADAETEYLALDKKCKTETGFAEAWATEYISLAEAMLTDHKDQVEALITFQENMVDVAKQHQG